jgi:hypothetical protein
LVRGEDRETAERKASGDTHKPLKIWQAEQAEQAREQAQQLGLLLAVQEQAQARLAEIERREVRLVQHEKIAKSSEAETIAAKRQAQAFSAGVDAWAAGEIKSVQKDGEKSVGYRDRATHERLSPIIQPAVEQLWEWMARAAKTVSAAVQKALEAQITPAAVQRAAEAHVTPQHVQAAADRLVTNQMIEDVLTGKVTAAQSAERTSAAMAFFQRKKGQGL